MKDFDKRKIYNDEIKPHLKVITEICQEHDMPFLSACLFGRENGKSRYGYAQFNPIKRFCIFLHFIIKLLNDDEFSELAAEQAIKIMREKNGKI